MRIKGTLPRRTYDLLLEVIHGQWADCTWRFGLGEMWCRELALRKPLPHMRCHFVIDWDGNS